MPTVAAVGKQRFFPAGIAQVSSDPVQQIKGGSFFRICAGNICWPLWVSINEKIADGGNLIVLSAGRMCLQPVVRPAKQCGIDRIQSAVNARRRNIFISVDNKICCSGNIIEPTGNDCFLATSKFIIP